jgi:putative ABC transport system permease protein
MTTNSVIILDRNSNIGYNSLESASDIVQGVSRVFPAFFLLVAALVCITTMTRMIDEERTQIGTLKALGYSNGAIIRKYLIYAGSGAVIGCGLGVFVGSAAFPVILWQAYKIMLYITDGILLKINWWLCGIVVGAYTCVMLLVTWYCCRKALREEPAELIRPKAPDPGKKILLEYLPFWSKISFLNKVTIRNIFRYRQRLAMMLVGIGGCTALLVTGFGLRDSIVNVVDYQFREVTTYDMSVYFSDGQTDREQADFIHDLTGKAEKVLFYHQSSMELDFNGKTREIYMIAAEAGITEFIDLHKNQDKIPVPGLNEVVISVGAAESMGIGVGDTVTMRNANLETLELTVSGIYDNHVQNYTILHPDTITAQWGAPAELQMAFVKVAQDQDAYSLSAEITGFSDVMNVSVSADLADMVGSMMDALDLVVWVVVFCAAALAAIVLYNLTNINITERLREIATIKVLGFNARETAMYVFKENLALTVIGSAMGLGLGYLLLLFVMSQIHIDMVYFKALVMPLSYIISAVLTVLTACFVCFIFYFKLDKINMAEALKSVE